MLLNSGGISGTMDKFLNGITHALSYSLQVPWLVSDFSFLLVFSLFLMIYTFIFDKLIWRQIFILALSLFFYYKSSGPFILLFFLIIALGYLSALLIHRTSGILKKSILRVAIFTISGTLIYFKHAYPFVINTNLFFGTGLYAYDWFLPIGITFCSLQTIGYLIDVYRGSVTPIKEITSYAFYMTYFPTVFFGPIIRTKDFLAQFFKLQPVNHLYLKNGLIRLFQGLVKILLLASYLGIFVNTIHESPKDFSGLDHLLSIYAFSFQLYFELSGFADIAIGLSLLMGIRIKENFDRPYHTSNLSLFWRKWLISISNWIRNYIYIPISGDKEGGSTTIKVLFLTGIISSLILGVDIRYLVFALIHVLVIYANNGLFRKDGKPKNTNLSRFVRILLTFNFVSFTWVFIRATSLENAFLSLKAIFTKVNFSNLLAFDGEKTDLLCLLLISAVVVFLPPKIYRYFQSKIIHLPIYMWFFLVLLLFQVLIQLKPNEFQMPFITHLF